MPTYLEFEKELAEIENKASELRSISERNNKLDTNNEAKLLDEKASKLLKDIYEQLTPWQKCLVARHQDRPHCLDYVKNMFSEFIPLAGDRNFAEDNAIIGGVARLDGRPIVIIGHEKGNDTKSRIKRNFGMARPEGYRKAIRLMDLANRFKIPVITLIDTPGAYPGKGAEERGQAEAIARSTEQCLNLEVPLISVIIGEGGSGGAVALATANLVIMLEHSIYSVISPEGCASILWKNPNMMREAAEALKLTSTDLKALGVVDSIIEEPIGGAQRDPRKIFEKVKISLTESINKLSKMSGKELREDRRDKFLEIGNLSL